MRAIATPPAGVIIESETGRQLAQLQGGTRIQPPIVADRDRQGTGRFTLRTNGSDVLLRDEQSGQETALPGPIAVCNCDDPSAPLSYPVWSSSGRFVSYVAGPLGKPDELRVVVVDLQTMEITSLEAGSRHARGIRGAVWQRDQERLVFERNGGVFVLDAASGAVEPIGTGSTAEFVTPQLLSFRSSGDLVLYDVGLRQEVLRVSGGILGSIEYANGRVRAVGRSDSPDCTGAVAIHPSKPDAICFPGASNLVWAPDGFRLGMIRAGASQTREVLVYDVGDGTSRTLASGLPQPVRCEWDYSLRWPTNNRYLLLNGEYAFCGV